MNVLKPCQYEPMKLTSSNHLQKTKNTKITCKACFNKVISAITMLLTKPGFKKKLNTGTSIGKIFFTSINTNHSKNLASWQT